MNPTNEESQGTELIGQLLEGRYRIVSLLGKGGFGSALLATDERGFERKVVIKIPHAEFLSETNFRARFEQEIRSLLQLDHPRIVKILDIGSYQGCPYAVLQYLAGGSLADRLHLSGLRQSAFEVKRWLKPLAEALDFIHRKNFLHRDVKPANILFDEEGNAYLSDFGIAKALESDLHLTQTGRIPGSPAFIAPEAVRHAALGPAYDQYALGVVVYQALCGHSTHDGETPLAILVQRAIHPARPLNEMVPGLPPGVSDVVMKSLTIDPAGRYTSCLAFAHAFEAALDRGASDDATEDLLLEVPSAVLEAPTQPFPLKPAAAAPPAQSPVHRAIAAGGFALLAIIAAFFWSLHGLPTPPAPSPTPTVGAATAAATPAASPTRPAASRTPRPTPRPGELESVALPYGLDLQLVWVPGGAFWMGCSEGAACDGSETPPHQVRVDGFWMGRFEVTQQQWVAVTGRNPSTFVGDTRPVESVTWDEAKLFLQAAGQGLRFPTEAEWEYAARGGVDHQLYPWGDNPPDGSQGNYCDQNCLVLGNDPRGDDGYATTCVIGSFSESRFGLFDLAGNVSEWCQDTFRPEAYKSRTGVSLNPVSLEGGEIQLDGQRRVTHGIRGGNWGSRPEELKVARRAASSSKSNTIGLRVARSAD